jgi:hypothetical protein
MHRPRFSVRFVSPTGAVTVHAIDDETTAADVVRRLRTTDARATALTFADCELPPDEPLASAGVMEDAELHVVHAPERLVARAYDVGPRSTDFRVSVAPSRPRKGRIPVPPSPWY